MERSYFFCLFPLVILVALTWSQPEGGLVSINLNNCRQVSSRTIRPDDSQTFLRRTYECSHRTPAAAAETDANRIELFSVVITSVANVDVQPFIAPPSPIIQQPQSQQPPNFNEESLPFAGNLSASRAGFVVPIDLSPLPMNKLLPGLGFGFGIGNGIFSNALITNTATMNTCTLIGKFAQNNNCSLYNVCWGFGRGQIGLVCPQDFAFDPTIKHCSRDWASCPLLARCTMNGQSLPDPSDNTRFFICVQNGFKLFATTYAKQFSVFRRSCPANMIFSVATQGCIMRPMG